MASIYSGSQQDGLRLRRERPLPHVSALCVLMAATPMVVTGPAPAAPLPQTDRASRHLAESRLVPVAEQTAGLRPVRARAQEPGKLCGLDRCGDPGMDRL